MPAGDGDKYSKGGKYLQFFVESALAVHIKNVQKGRIATHLGPMDVLHRGNPIANMTQLEHEEVPDEDGDEEEEEDEMEEEERPRPESAGDGAVGGSPA